MILAAVLLCLAAVIAVSVWLHTSSTAGRWAGVVLPTPGAQTAAGVGVWANLAVAVERYRRPRRTAERRSRRDRAAPASAPVELASVGQIAHLGGAVVLLVVLAPVGRGTATGPSALSATVPVLLTTVYCGYAVVLLLLLGRHLVRRGRRRAGRSG